MKDYFRKRVIDQNPAVFVPVAAKNTEEAVLLAEEAAALPCDGIEFRADIPDDFLSLSDTERMLFYRKLRRAAGSRLLLYTFRTVREGGKTELSPDDFKRVAEKAIQSGCFDLIDLELQGNWNSLLSLAKENRTGVILSYHDFHAVPPERKLVEIYRNMEKAGADAAKIACMPGGYSDTIRFLDGLLTAGNVCAVPLIGIAMGEYGTITRTGGGLFSSCLTFASYGKKSAPGQLSVSETVSAIQAIRKRTRSDGHLWLTGFMGSGKSSIGKLVANKLSLPLYEMDDEIAAFAGRSIPDIFRTEGEKEFRLLESEVLLDICGRERGVVSCGGGVILAERNRKILRAGGTVVYLTASPETIWQRLESERSQRPLLASAGSAEDLFPMMNEREALYEECCDLKVPTDGKSLENIAGQIAVENGY